MGTADDMKRLGEDIVASYDMRVEAIGELVRDVHKNLKGFAADRKKLSAEQAKALAGFEADLAKDVGSMIGAFQKEHKEMADNLGASLEGGEAERLKSFEKMMGGIKKGVRKIERHVANSLKEFHNAHADMSEALRKDLAKYVAGIAREVKNLLGGFEDERKKMAANWQGTAITMAKRQGMKPKVRAVKPAESRSGCKATVRPAAQAVGKAKPVEKRV